jgi:Rrf2 family iron-sulfur cluster assembly transcriptional regulator
MIRLSTKGRYGTRLMVSLAQYYHNGRESIILKKISDDEEISIRYLEQIIIPLKIARLVKSIRGAGGGYILARHPSDIKLREILSALEGSCCLVECVDDEDYCDKIEECATYEIWKNASALLKDYFENTTLEDLLKVSNKKKASARK